MHHGAKRGERLNTVRGAFYLCLYVKQEGTISQKPLKPMFAKSEIKFAMSRKAGEYGAGWAQMQCTLTAVRGVCLSVRRWSL